MKAIPALLGVFLSSCTLAKDCDYAIEDFGFTLEIEQRDKSLFVSTEKVERKSQLIPLTAQVRYKVGEGEISFPLWPHNVGIQESGWFTVTSNLNGTTIELFGYPDQGGNGVLLQAIGNGQEFKYSCARQR